MKKVLFFSIVIICLIVINNLVHSSIDTWQKQAFVTEAQKELQSEEKRHQQLEKQLKYVSQSAFVEEQARDKLLLVKPGEEMILLPTGSSLPIDQKSHAGIERKPHWQEWIDYFFG